MRKKVLFSAMLTGLLFVAACSSGFKPDHEYSIQPFEYTNQDGDTVSLDDLNGEVWLAQFIFTNCTSICPPMMMNMADLQGKLDKEGVEDYKIVSFSVDPDHDTPEKLKQYLEQFGVPDESKWIMLTGYKMSEINKLSVDSFKMPVFDDPNSNQVIHGSRFGLVNQDGKVVKTYSGANDVPYDQIVKDMKALIKQGAE
ncbi:SCO family protein [Sporosarcina sp. Te-1]|uniref:SCO family protein n=1 Tax=Sporosarcina sp. Te-1 TaxID=2818390 RepID=UPI001A9E6430|nr:SCO family protein [Sporosarcina sp. Te-1]QTD42093.1 SCO family protein [Sporosarcina sp. Te-1]